METLLMIHYVQRRKIPLLQRDMVKYHYFVFRQQHLVLVVLW
jgi:hypothetical protein